MESHNSSILSFCINSMTFAQSVHVRLVHSALLRLTTITTPARRGASFVLTAIVTSLAATLTGVCYWPRLVTCNILRLLGMVGLCRLSWAGKEAENETS